MDKNKVLFIGGKYPRMLSVGIRCIDIARYLGCDYVINNPPIEEISNKYKAFICVKVKYSHDYLELLKSKGLVIWDILDRPPPPPALVDGYISSTRSAGLLVADSGRRIELIPHQHCCYDGAVNGGSLRRPAWIGQYLWYPDFMNFDHDVYDVRRMNHTEVCLTLKTQVGIGLNLRVCNERSYLHAQLNSGLKLINCIGYGIPSVSQREPGYLEYGDEECTVYVGRNDCSVYVQELQLNTGLYNRIRDNCLKRAHKFSLQTVCQQYANLIASL